jgi:hypothetical protein
MGRGEGKEILLEEALPLDHLFSELGIDPIVDPEAAWEALYSAHPELFASLPNPISLPTEWPVIAFLYAIAHQEIEEVRFSAEEKKEIDRGANILEGLTGLRLPRVALYKWKEDSVSFAGYYERVNPGSRGFSFAAEPQLKTVIIIKPSLLKKGTLEEKTRIISHEVHHAAHATTANPRPGLYRQELIAYTEELAVLFCEVVLGMILRENGCERDYFEEWIIINKDSSSARWLEIVLDLTPGLEVGAMAKKMSDIALEVLGLQTDSEAALALNNRSHLSLGADEWIERFSEADFKAR